MIALHSKAAAIFLTTYYNHAAVQAVMIGDEVCTTGYIMDKFCIDRGTLLDNRFVTTLEEPEKHSFHCLLDVGICKNSGYIVLTDTKDDTGLHCLGYRLSETQRVLDAGLPAGRYSPTGCTDCTGDETKPEYGYRATIKGTVVSLGDGSDGDIVSGTPVIDNIEVLDESVGCEVDTVEPVCMGTITATATTSATTTTTVVSEPATEFPTLMPSMAPLPFSAGMTPGVPTPASSCPEALTQSTVIDPSATLYYHVIPSDPPGSNNGILCARLEVDNHDGWVGFAISEEGNMSGSEAVIGNPFDGTVLKYDLGSYAVADVTAMPDNAQTLMNPSIMIEEDDDDEVEIKTIMTFGKLLVEEDEIRIVEDGMNLFLHARGDGNALGYHGDDRFVFDVTFGSTETTTKPSTEAPTTAKPTMNPITNSPTRQPTSKPVLVTNLPTEPPTTAEPTMKPVTDSPTQQPSTKPVLLTNSPTPAPFEMPFSLNPTENPTTLSPVPDNLPTVKPTVAEGFTSTDMPTNAVPSSSPSDKDEPTTAAPNTDSPVVAGQSSTKPTITTTNSPTEPAIVISLAPSRNPFADVSSADLLKYSTVLACVSTLAIMVFC